MDLLALSSADGRLAVRRLDWTRLWSARVGASTNANPSSSSATTAATAATATTAAAATAAKPSPAPASVTALAWRPDGRALAVASRGGGLEVRAAEDGEVLASLSSSSSGKSSSSSSSSSSPFFVALSWATDGEGGPAAAAAAPLSLRDSLVASGPPLPPCPLPPPADFDEKREAAAEEGAEAEAEATTATTTSQRAPPPRHEPLSLQVLAAADSEGCVHLFGPGLIPLARLPVAEAARKKKKKEAGEGEEEVVVEIRAVALSTGLDSLHVLLASHSPPSSDVNSDDDTTESLSLATVDTRALSRARRELTRVLHAAGHALSLLSVASRSAEAAAAHWQEAGSILEKEMLLKLEKLQADFGEGGEGDGGGGATKMEEGEREGNGRIGQGGALIGGSSNKESASSSTSSSAFSSPIACLSKAALCGGVSAPLAHFWESDPGPRGLRAAAKAADAACRSTSELVGATTGPALEAACYFVGELQRVAESASSSLSSPSSSSSGRWGGALGLGRAEAAEASRRSRDAAAAASAASMAVAAGVASSRSLFMWLMASAARVTTTAASATAAAAAAGDDGDERGGEAEEGSNAAAATARAAARTISAVLPRGDPLAATAALSKSVAVNPRLAAAVALGTGGTKKKKTAAEEEEKEKEALAVASCDPLCHPGVPSAVLDALGRRSWPPAGHGTMRGLARAAASAVEGMLAAVCWRLSAEMEREMMTGGGGEEAAAGEAPLGLGARGAQVCLVAGNGNVSGSKDDDDTSNVVRAAAAFIAPGGSAAVAVRAVGERTRGSGGTKQRPLSVEVAAVAPVVVGGGETGEQDSPLPPPLPAPVVGVGLYKGHALALLSGKSGGNGGGGGMATTTLALVTADELSFAPPCSSSDFANAENEKSVTARCRLLFSSSTSSSSPSSDTSLASPLLAVSASRGVACALTAGGLRAIVLDLEEDDDEEEEEEEEEDVEGEKEKGAAKSSDDDDDDENGQRHHHHNYDSDDTSSLSGGSDDGGMSSE